MKYLIEQQNTEGKKISQTIDVEDHHEPDFLRSLFRLGHEAISKGGKVYWTIVEPEPETNYEI